MENSFWQSILQTTYFGIKVECTVKRECWLALGGASSEIGGCVQEAGLQHVQRDNTNTAFKQHVVAGEKRPRDCMHTGGIPLIDWRKEQLPNSSTYEKGCLGWKQRRGWSSHHLSWRIFFSLKRGESWRKKRHRDGRLRVRAGALAEAATYMFFLDGAFLKIVLKGHWENGEWLSWKEYEEGGTLRGGSSRHLGKDGFLA
ncbi:hypothetical protein LR48_Vigan09g047700 [Vigna angularis]|uniref:Uncharacterized protein n=1 Tax=Phaseolus angularis TaxID=3914 RepID=A0A0L9V9Y7_PHAAN|nr:hypothetical protein LR48_Vigan09g047700 [Vigna angularis]